MILKSCEFFIEKDLQTFNVLKREIGRSTYIYHDPTIHFYTLEFFRYYIIILIKNSTSVDFRHFYVNFYFKWTLSRHTFTDNI